VLKSLRPHLPAVAASATLPSLFLPLIGRESAARRWRSLSFKWCSMRFFTFQCGYTGIYALSIDKTGANLPRLEGATPWLLRDALDDARLRLHFPGTIDTLMHKGFCLVDQAELKRTG
jgi:hypothetical protein